MLGKVPGLHASAKMHELEERKVATPSEFLPQESATSEEAQLSAPLPQLEHSEVAREKAGERRVSA